MNEQIINFIKQNRICVISILQPDGSIHAATVHFSSDATNTDVAEFYIATSRTSRKCRSLGEGNPVHASMVIGFNEEQMITLQMDGEVQMLMEADKIEKVKEVHYAMHPFAKKFEGDPNTCFLQFSPSWWRYSEFKASPPVFVSSEK